MTRPTQSALTPSLARTPDELTATNVVAGWIESSSIFVAPALTGVVLAIGSEAIAFALVSAGCVGGMLLVAPLRGLGAPVNDTPASSEDGFVGSLLFVRADRQARLMLLLLGAECIAIGALDVLLVEFARGALDRGADWVGYLTAAFGAGGVLAVGLTARLVGLARLARPFVGALAVWSVALMGLAVLPGAVGSPRAPRRGGWGPCTRSTSLAGRLLQRMAPPDLLARVFGLLEGVQNGALAIGDRARASSRLDRRPAARLRRAWPRRFRCSPSRRVAAYSTSTATRQSRWWRSLC